jgi:nicotinate-nucleotide--dimethylbenzimidazole phosphoribosyltransferase
MMKSFSIKPINKNLIAHLQNKVDNKTKPLGALGKLERIAIQIGSIQNSLEPQLIKPTIVVFAGDHGIVKEGVSPYPQKVTYQMVFNFLQGGAGINVFAKQHGIEIKVVDAGVNFNFETHPDLINGKIDTGTRSYLSEPAMTQDQCHAAINKGGDIVEEIRKAGCNIIGFGEMGIGNTSSAAILMSLLCDIPLDDCIGRGTGLDDGGLQKKKAVLKSAIMNQHQFDKTPIGILKTFGGFEIAMMCGAMLKAAELEMILLIDGFIATSALLVASKINQYILEYCIFAHQSDEQGHRLMLEHLHAEPLLSLDMRLGEGTGVAVAYPMIASAVHFLNQMASFESAGVNTKE